MPASLYSLSPYTPDAEIELEIELELELELLSHINSMILWAVRVHSKHCKAVSVSAVNKTAELPETSTFQQFKLINSFANISAHPGMHVAKYCCSKDA
jgi:hypothetical protein